MNQFSLLNKLKELDKQISEYAEIHNISSMDLRLQTGLHLPRLEAEGEWNNERALTEEVNRLSKGIKEIQSLYSFLSKKPSEDISLGSLRFGQLLGTEVDQIIMPILERFHYLRSFRKNSAHYALKTSNGRVVALATISSFDLPHILNELKNVDADISPQNILVVSRIYAFRFAPHNSISYLLGKVISEIKLKYPEVCGVMTYLNPNLGFTGTTYKASNWKLCMQEKANGYIYLDKNYITQRRFEELNGNRMSIKVIKSRMPLQPLDIYFNGWGPLGGLMNFKEVKEISI